jgi:hypothetical protein
MSKAFWEGFRTGFTTAIKYGIPIALIALVFVLGLYLGSASHPYEVCKKQYDTQEDISECVWIRMNP